jgi:predicted DNA-binding protein (UPF0251 family)/predicted Fe-Mo cluster-binding NifX family protein
MSRPCCLRRIGAMPYAVYFKPAGIPVRALTEVVLTLDELEALRLADLNGLYQEQAAGEMNISRPTFARIVESARRKTADALIHGKALRVAGGTVAMKGEQTMPGQDGTGPVNAARGLRRGPCGCGQRHGAQAERGATGRSVRIAIPVAQYRALESPVYGHFGSAPAFALVDSETMAVEAIANRDRGHVHGACSPMEALAGARPDAVIVGGIGAGALMGLRAAGIKVYRAEGGTVAEAVSRFKAAELPEIDASGACAGHGGGHSCHRT